MKCPKCSYLGFETGDRCRNCGYDFSLMASGPSVTPDVDVTIRTDDSETVAPEIWLDRLDQPMNQASDPMGDPPLADGSVDATPAEQTTTPNLSLPLFNPKAPDDLPLITLPAAPRPPLAVRRTPDAPRPRALSKGGRQPEPALNFRGEMYEEDAAAERPDADAPALIVRGARPSDGTESVGGRRLVAALIDHAMLLGIDLSVVYFTLRMAGLDGASISALPLAPLVTFLVFYKLAYFSAFTAVGGQTIGKMTVGIRVIGDGGRIDSARAIRRTLASLLSLLPLGLGLLPAFFGSDRRALHDRLTHTRVVGLPSA